jgi:hypothetical protein
MHCTALRLTPMISAVMRPVQWASTGGLPQDSTNVLAMVPAAGEHAG